MGILLVMGSDIDARLAAHLLASLDCSVTVAISIADAERAASRRRFDVAIVDIASLDGDRLHLVRTLARDGFVLVLSPSTDVTDKVQALDAGADDYMVYPYEPAELIARVRAAIRRRGQYVHASPGGSVRVGSAYLDVNGMEVSVPGRPRIRLTPNEMRLLLYLMTHAERAVNQPELLAHLFGPDAPQVSSNAVGVYIRRVRQKIERNPDQPRYVVTLRGQGYQFMSPDEEVVTISSS